MRPWWMVLAIGCGGGGGGDSGNCPDHSTIVSGAFARAGTTLTWTLEVAGMPETLEFDRAGVPNFVLEYGWQIELDADGDNVHELEVAAKHFKEDREPRIAPPLDVLQVDLWAVDGPVASLTGSADATIIGNTFTFTVEEDEDPGLALIVDPAQSRYSTFFLIGRSALDPCTDEL